MNREQFIFLVKGEQEGLRRYLLAFCCGNRDEADDIAQETLMKAYLSLNSYRDEKKFASWLRTIAHNTFLDHRKSARTALSIEDVHQAVASDGADDAYRYEELHAALALLPDKERSALLLFHLEGYSIREVAQIVGASENTVKQQLFRGREHLKKLMDKR